MGKYFFKGDQDWKKWFAKWGKGLVVTVSATGLLYTASYMQVNPLPVSSEYVFFTGLIITILNQIGNFLQHA
jgi:hypothetical protein